MNWPLGSGLVFAGLIVRNLLLGVWEIWIRSELGCVGFEISARCSLSIGRTEYFCGNKSYQFFVVAK